MAISHIAIAYSLQKFIEVELGFTAHILYDGFKMPDEKPFALIKYMPNAHEQLSKQRESIHTIFRLELSIYAESSWQLSKYQEELRDLILFREIPLYDSDGILTYSVFLFEPDFNEVPVPADELTDHTSRHRMVFDLEVHHVFNKRGTK